LGGPARAVHVGGSGLEPKVGRRGGFWDFPRGAGGNITLSLGPPEWHKGRTQLGSRRCRCTVPGSARNAITRFPSELFCGRSSCGFLRRPQLQVFEGGGRYCRLQAQEGMAGRRFRVQGPMLQYDRRPVRQMQNSTIGTPSETSRCAPWCRAVGIRGIRFGWRGGGNEHGEFARGRGRNQHGESERGAELKTAILPPRGFPPTPPAPPPCCFPPGKIVFHKFHMAVGLTRLSGWPG
jgi:hypothetical protein